MSYISSHNPFFLLTCPNQNTPESPLLTFDPNTTGIDGGRWGVGELRTPRLGISPVIERCSCGTTDNDINSTHCKQPMQPSPAPRYRSPPFP